MGRASRTTSGFGDLGLVSTALASWSEAAMRKGLASKEGVGWRELLLNMAGIG
ncbi:MAG: hypothetical protein O3A87_10580 [Verrucomicrobia bacterium]|nr:hypothetical protein [Verrucomicrobiota bacterium]